MFYRLQIKVMMMMKIVLPPSQCYTIKAATLFQTMHTKRCFLKRGTQSLIDRALPIDETDDRKINQSIDDNRCQY